LKICHFLSYIFIFSGITFWLEEETRIPLKRKNEDAGGCPDVKRARVKQLACSSLEDAEDDGGPSNLLLNDDEDYDDVLILDTDEDLLKEMDMLLSDLKL
jgi:hypothetical protein